MLQRLMALFRRGEYDYEDEEQEDARPEPPKEAPSQKKPQESQGESTPERKRRQVIRHNCEAVVEMQMGVALAGANDWSTDTVKTKARVLDLSLQGCAVFTKSGFDQGQRVRVLITVQDGTKITGEGMICWTRAVAEKNGHAAGVEFTRITPDDLKRIAKFLTQLEKTLGL